MISDMKDAFSVKGKNVLVTGGNRGIGRGIAEAFAQSGCNVGIMARNGSASERAVNELAPLGGKCAHYIGDATRRLDCKRVVESFVNDFGKIDVLVNNAGTCRHTYTLDMNEELDDWFDVINLNMNAMFMMSFYAAKYMKESGGGSIINITSISANLVNHPQFQVSYNASKAGAQHMSRSLAVEWIPYNIRVNDIAPGYVDTEMSNTGEPQIEQWRKVWMDRTPKGRWGSPLEIGALAVYIASDAAKYAVGSTFTLDGGYQLPR